MVQAAVIAACRNPIRTYNLGILAFLSTLVQIAIRLATSATDGTLLHRGRLSSALHLVELALAVSLALANLGIPRRPDVFHNGGRVDRLLTATALRRFTWGWAAPVMSLAARKGDLDQADLDVLGYNQRARDAMNEWERHGRYRQGFLWALLGAHRRSLAVVYTATIIRSVFTYAPSFALLQILRHFEADRQDAARDPAVWLWVAFLALAEGVLTCISVFIVWTNTGQTWSSVQVQVVSLVFRKAMRKNNVKSPDATGEDDAPNDKKELQTHNVKNIINLISIDTKNIIVSIMDNNMLFSALVEILAALALLLNVLGWQPMLAGCLVFFLTTPAQSYFSKRYGDAQSRLMEVRDRKTAMVTEAVSAIKQVKLMSMESDWLAAIHRVRQQELGKIRATFVQLVWFDTTTVFSPIAVLAVSLGVYSALHGRMEASVAFVSLSVIQLLEVTVSELPTN